MDEQPEREASHVPAAAAAPRAGASSPLIGGGAGRVSGPESIEQLQELLGTQSYLADRGLATAVFLALSLGQPLLLEGEAGVGKTEVAKALAAALRRRAHPAAVLRGHRRQPGALRVELPAPAALRAGAARARLGRRRRRRGDLLFSLPDRAAAAAGARAGERAVLLIDEIDRADDEFEAFLLEVLSDFQVTIPEIGTIHAEQPPLVVLTSNRTRELHDALKRRCLYHWIDYPDPRSGGRDRPRPRPGGGGRARGEGGRVRRRAFASSTS